MMMLESSRCHKQVHLAHVLTIDLTLPANSLDTSAANVDDSCLIHSGVEIIAENERLIGHVDGGENESLVGHGNGSEMIQSAKDEVNIEKDPGLWLDFSADDMAYWTACGLSECQHHNGPFDKSYRYFGSDKPARFCSQKLFVGEKANGEKYKREWLLYLPSTGSVYCFVCKLFAPTFFSHFVTREGSVTGEILL